ncbi:RpiB/LacA/LacB family sugar-phosphate isomerase [Anaeromicropila herbilytica]|uniref:Sugar phosphate isomerase n=1 Tax=Anaeromicropila herbilytica TaxID=2785025 RepID=A0A7R7EPL8_9FIRM|nr:RpiB/LacA/LacB family sugar-phosphate isomerase [Anaeromicropila herbilytica]BCN32694.1 sugar phosphate isomerase [Anaeromicropila herbilytica]
MKIAIIQASSQKDKNPLLYDSVSKAIEGKGYEVINFGIFKEEDVTYSYIQTALMISILLESKAVDFVVTGCSSGQGMMLACNSLPGVLCGYVENPADAYLFGRINNGNAVSYPLGLNFGWAGEINLQSTMEKLFKGDFGMGYPKEDALRKQRDTKMLKAINQATKRSLVEVLPVLDSDLVKSALKRKEIIDYVLQYGTNVELKNTLETYL